MPKEYIDKQEKKMNQATESYYGNVTDQRDSFIDNQTAQADTAYAENTTELQKAYDRAIQEGTMDKEEARKQFDQGVEAINQQAYQQQQVNNLTGQQRGIQNSQQMIGLQQGNQRNQLNQTNESRNARDDRIADIRNRLATITNEHDLNLAFAGREHNNTLRSIDAQGRQMYAEGMQNIDMARFQGAQQLHGQMMSNKQQNQYAIQQMDRQQQHNLQTLEAKHGYTMEQLDQQNIYTLGQMKVQHGYSMEQQQAAFQQDLAKMARQAGYNSNLETQRHNNTIKQIGAQASAGIEQEKKQYERERSRMTAQFTPGTPEYNIRNNQLKEASEQRMTQIHQDAVMGALSETMRPGMRGFDSYVNNPQQVMQSPASYMNNADPNNAAMRHNAPRQLPSR